MNWSLACGGVRKGRVMVCLPVKSSAESPRGKGLVMNDLVKSKPKNEIVVYQPNETMRLEVRIENDTAWLSRQQMARLFGRDVKTIGKHVANALKEELAPLVAKSATSDVIPMNPVVAKFATTAADGKTYQVEYYGLEMITSVGYRVKSPEGVCFRMWANQVLRNYMLNGVSVNQRMIAMEDRIDRRLSKHDADIIVLIVDDTVWHIGASPKDAGSALFAMMKMKLDPAVILGLLP